MEPAGRDAAAGGAGMVRRLVTTVTSAVLVATMAGCGSGAESEPPAPEPSEPAASPSVVLPPAYDPPLGFAETGVQLGRPDGEYTVHDAVAYFVTENDELASDDNELVAVELATGEPRWTQPVTGPSPRGQWPTPAVADGDAGPVVFMPMRVEQPGSGTTPSRELVRVAAYDGATGTPLWSADIDDTDVSESEILGYSDLYVFANQDHVVASVEYLADGRNYNAYTAVFDAATGDARWLEAGFLASTLDDQTVVGNTAIREGLEQHYTLVGRAAPSGDQVWTIGEPERIRNIYGLGSGLGYYVGVPEGGSTTYLVELATGRVLTSFDGGSSCHYDGEAIVVCGTVDFYTFDDYLVAYDVQAGARLWELPDEAANRIAPSELAAVRPGAVYASTDNGPLILDARTGEDLVTDLPFAVERVVPGFGLWRDGLELWAHPATR